MQIVPLTLTVVDVPVGLDNVEQISSMYRMKGLHSRRGGGHSSNAGAHCSGSLDDRTEKEVDPRVHTKAPPLCLVLTLSKLHQRPGAKFERLATMQS